MPRNPDADIVIRPVAGAAELETTRGLFLAYAESLGFDLCFQGFDQELATLPGAYTPPRGALWLAWRGREAVGCIGLRPFDDHSCEMKRLYVTPQGRGHGTGRQLVHECLAGARQRGYRTMYLDTMRSEMTAAQQLYADLGFREIAPYHDKGLPGLAYYALDLTTA